MPRFAVSLLSECHVEGATPPVPLRELAIHIVRASDEAEATAKGAEIGARRAGTFRTMNSVNAEWTFQGVVECQCLHDREFADGMEVSSWIYEGERLCLPE